MADRFQKLFSLENNLYIENAPIIISAAALLKDTKSGNIVVQVKFKSVSNKNIKGVKISLSAYDVSGKEINGADDYQYLDLNIPNGQSFGSNKAIVMPETTTRSFTIKSLTVIFADSSIWENASPDFVVIPNAKTLNCELENEELVKQYKIATTNKAKYVPNTFLNLWTCCCGEVNSEEYCTNCGTNKNNTFSKYDITDLTVAMNVRLDKEKEERLELERQAEVDKIAVQKKKRKSLFITCLTSIILIVCIVLYVLLSPVFYYKNGIKQSERENYFSAAKSFSNAGNYKNSKELMYKQWENILPKNIISSGFNHAVILNDDVVTAIGSNTANQCNVENFSNIKEALAGQCYSMLLKNDGTVVVVGDTSAEPCQINDWTDIISISTGRTHTVGIKSDHTVVATYSRDYGVLDLSDWKDIVAVSSGTGYCIGLKQNGKVVSTGKNDYGQTNVSNWKNIVAVSASGSHTIGLKSDGTVVATGYNYKGRTDVDSWSDIIAISTGGYHTVGLKKDGTVVAVGENDNGQCNVSSWKDIIAISAGNSFTLGLKSDGTIMSTDTDIK